MVDLTERASGRTSRMILNAIVAASEENEVIIVTANFNQTKWMMGKVRNALHALGIRHHTGATDKNCIRFTHSPKSQITIVAEEEAERKIESHKVMHRRDPVVYTDHYVIDKKFYEIDRRRTK